MVTINLFFCHFSLKNFELQFLVYSTNISSMTYRNFNTCLDNADAEMIMLMIQT